MRYTESILYGQKSGAARFTITGQALKLKQVDAWMSRAPGFADVHAVRRYGEENIWSTRSNTPF